MKICLFTENHLKGGVDTFLINLINSWNTDSDEISLACNASHPGINTLVKEIHRKIKIIKYNRLYTSKIAARQDKLNLGNLLIVKAFMVITYRCLQYPLIFPWYVISLAIWFRKSPFDRLMVVNGGYPASLICRAAIVGWGLSGKKTLAVLNFHSGALVASKSSKPFENFIDTLVAKYSSSVISVSNDCISTLDNREKLKGFRGKAVISNGINDPIRRECNRESKIQLGKDEYILMLATYEPRKGHIFLLSAFKKINKIKPNLKLQIYGYGNKDQIAHVRAECIRLDLGHVVTLNEFTTEKFELIKNASIVVVPSQEYESFNYTIIEAMACGTPVVATDVGGMPEIIGDSSAGIICSKSDPNEFAQAILRILNDKSIGEEMGQQGRQTYLKKYKSDLMAKRYREQLVNNQ